jgi:hypothetical protein
MMTAVAAGAQGTANSCAPGLAQDACQMAVDVFQLMSPQLGLALAGGNATLGSGSTLGGPGHFSVGLRANFFQGDLPDVEKFSPNQNGRVQRTGAQALPASSQLEGLATADAAIGIFRGVPLPLTNVGGIDLLLSASYVPNFGALSNVKIEPDRNLQVGYGVRVGLLQESILTPGVSFTFLKRDLPTTTILGTSPTIDVSVRDAKVKTSAYRVVASKNLLVFGLAGGIGQDRYSEEANVQGTIKGPLIGPGGEGSAVVALSQKLTRTNYFVDVSANFPLFKIVGEVGQVTGGTVDTYNEFETGRADKSRTYGSVGFRIAY